MSRFQHRRVAVAILLFVVGSETTFADPHASTLRLLGYGTRPSDEVVSSVVLSGSPRLAEELLARIPDVDAFEAARAGDLARLKLVLLANSEAAKPIPGIEDRSLLEAAVDGGDRDVVRLVLARSLDVSKEKDLLGRAIRDDLLPVVDAFCEVERLKPLLEAALHDACWQRRTAIAKRMIAAEINVTEARAWGFQAIHAAMFRRENELVELLLENGAEVDVFVAAGLGRLAQMNELLDTTGIPSAFGKSVGPHPAFFAARTGQMSTLQPFLSNASVLRLRGHRRFTVLVAAAESGTAEVMQALLDAGASRSATAILWDEKQANPLHFAAANGNVAAARVLLEAGFDVDSKTENGTTALGLAARFGHPEMTRLLLEAGASVDAPKSGVETPLYAAAAAGSLDVCRLLLEASATVDGVNKTPLRVAVANGHRGVAKLLLDRGANPLGTLPTTPEDRVVVTPLGLAVQGDDERLVEILIEAGLDVNRPQGEAPSHRSPLLLALRNGRAANAERLLASGAVVRSSEREEAMFHVGRVGDSELLDAFDPTALVALAVPVRFPPQDPRAELIRGAIERDNKDILRTLAMRGTDFDAAIGADDTPLSLAARLDRRRALRALLEAGADPHRMPPTGEMGVVDLAMSDGSMEAVRMLVAFGARPSGPGGWHLVAAAGEGDLSTMSTLLELGYGVDGPRRTGEPLAAAIENSHFDAARLLIRAGARLDVRDAAGRTPLHWAAAVSDTPRELLDVFIEKGVEAQQRNHEGLTALHVAVASKNDVAIAALSDREIAWDLHLAAGLGNLETVEREVQDDPLNIREELPPLGAPLEWAAAGGHSDVVRFLIASGGRTTAFAESMTRAVQDGDVEMIAFLAEHGVSVNGTATKYGEPLAIAIHARRADLVRALLDVGANPNGSRPRANAWQPLQMAATRGLTEITTLLLEAGAHVNATGFGGYSALDLALDPAAFASTGQSTRDTRGDPDDKLAVAKLLLDAGARERVGKPGKLARAAAAGAEEVVESLLEAGADPNEANDRMGTTPLVAVVQARLAKTRNLPDEERMQRQAGYVRIAEALLERGAKPTLPDAEGRTPLNEAGRLQDEKLVELFEDFEASRPE